MANSLKDKLAANAAIKGNGLDALLGNNPMDAMRVDDRRVQDIALNKLHPFEGHTFLVVKNSDYASMVDSIRNSGVTVPLIVRPHPTIAGDFEIIAGHRRFSASTDAGLREVPCLVTNIDNLTASKIMVETNIQRPEWLPSEKARSFKLWTDTVKTEQNIKLGRRTNDSADDPVLGRASEVACKRFGISARMLDMYIKLNGCSDAVLSLCDAGRMTVTAAYQLSFLTDEQQAEVADKMAADTSMTLNEVDAKAIRYTYEGRPMEMPAASTEDRPQASEPVPDEVRDNELSSGDYPEGYEPSGGGSHDASHDAGPVETVGYDYPDTEVEEGSTNAPDAVADDTAAATQPAVVRPQKRLSWATIDGKAKTAPSKGVRVTFVFDEPEILGGNENEVRQRLNEVVRSGNKELLMALAETLYDAMIGE